MNEAEDVRDQGSSNVSVPLLVGSAIAGAGALWLALATPLLGISVELILGYAVRGTSTNPVPLMDTLSGFIPLTLVTVGLSLCTRSLTKLPGGLAVNGWGTLLGIMAGIALLIGAWAAIVGCQEITAAFKALDGYGEGVDPKATGELLIQNLRSSTEILTVDTPRPFLVAPVMLVLAALLGFSGGSATSARHGKRLVIFSIIISVFVIAVFSLQLRDTFALERIMTSGENLDLNKMVDTFAGSRIKALLGYTAFAVHGVLLILATLLGRRST